MKSKTHADGDGFNSRFNREIFSTSLATTYPKAQNVGEHGGHDNEDDDAIRIYRYEREPL